MKNTKVAAEVTPERIPSKRTKVAELEQQIDERDETIRLLNEALSRALDQLAEAPKAA